MGIERRWERENDGVKRAEEVHGGGDGEVGVNGMVGFGVYEKKKLTLKRKLGLVSCESDNCP